MTLNNKHYLFLLLTVSTIKTIPTPEIFRQLQALCCCCHKQPQLNKSDLQVDHELIAQSDLTDDHHRPTTPTSSPEQATSQEQIAQLHFHRSPTHQRPPSENSWSDDDFSEIQKNDSALNQTQSRAWPSIGSVLSMIWRR